MSHYFLALLSLLFTSDSLKINLGTKTGNSNWSIVNDGVMGGLSRGQIAYEDQYVRFSGKLSLENNGGFSWMKSDRMDLDLSKFKNVRLKVKGEGRDYDFTLETQTGYSALYFKHTFSTTKAEWTIIELPLPDFQQKYFGRNTGKSYASDINVKRLGFLMNDKNSGAFQVDVEYIEFY